MNSDLLYEAQTVLRKRVCGQELPANVGNCFKEEFNNLHSVLKRSVEFGEGNSILIVGPKGCGKTTIVRAVLEKLRKLKNFTKDVFEVHLSGLLQTDDRQALLEITRQLQLENTLGDKVFGSFADTLSFLLSALKSGNTSSSSPVLFFLDHFDLFAQHKHQTLLYNLFDIAQSSSTPICVVGITCRYDVMDLLEKRVKSRFSHRQIFVTNSWNFNEYVNLYKTVLELDISFTDKMTLNDRRKFVSTWNKGVIDLMDNPAVQHELRNVFNFTKQPSTVNLLLMKPVCLMENKVGITADILIKSLKEFLHDSKENILLGLSVLELCLVIAMIHLFNIYHGEPFNFQMAYNEYMKFARRKSSVLQNHTKQVGMKAFERLIELELIQPHETTAGSSFGELTSRTNLQKEYRLINLTIDQDQLHSAIHKYHGCPTDIKQWAICALPS